MCGELTESARMHLIEQGIQRERNRIADALLRKAGVFGPRGADKKLPWDIRKTLCDTSLDIREGRL